MIFIGGRKLTLSMLCNEHHQFACYFSPSKSMLTVKILLSTLLKYDPAPLLQLKYQLNLKKSLY